jgi:hypothetical protein
MKVLISAVLFFVLFTPAKARFASANRHPASSRQSGFSTGASSATRANADKTLSLVSLRLANQAIALFFD